MYWEGININLKSTGMEMSSPIEDYVIKKVTNLGKLLKKIQERGGEVGVYFEVAKTTGHHKTGPVFRADCSIRVDGEQFYSSARKESIYDAIDECKNQLFREIGKKKEKGTALWKRGAQKLKDLARSAIFWKK